MSDQEILDEMVDVVAESQAAQSGWFDTLKERSKYAMERLHESRAIILDIILYAGLGFLCGFLLRKYANYVAFLVLIVVGLIILQQYDTLRVVINWTKFNDFFGFQHAPTITSDSLVTFWEWCKANAIIVVSWIMGLLIGLKVG